MSPVVTASVELTALWAGVAILCLLMFWDGACASRVYKQRRAMRDRCIPGTPSCAYGLLLARQLTYAEHKRELFWLRDPRRLYAARAAEMGEDYLAALDTIWPERSAP